MATPLQDSQVRPDKQNNQSHRNPNQPANYMPSVRAASEKKLGLLHFSSPQNHGWHGDVRKRFSDFLVNEIQKNGEVLHLSDYTVAARPTNAGLQIPGENPHTQNQQSVASSPVVDAQASQVSEEDTSALQSLLGEPTTQALKELYERVIASGANRLDPKANSVKFPHMERNQRGQAHQEIRRIFKSKLDTETGSDGFITAVPSNKFTKNPRAGGQRQRSDLPSFKKLGGDYIHFTLYKENKDTMDAINQMCRILKVKANNFGFAGTKDRRAATVQRISAYHVKHETLHFLNSQLPFLKVGDHKYSKYPIQLGDHGGNEFKITVKNVSVSRGHGCSLKRRVQMTKQAVGAAVSEMAKYGFINYFGLQRFGTHFVGTHELGKMILMEDYEAVIDGMLHVDSDFMSQVMAGSVEETPANRDEINRVRAVVHWKTAKNAKAALQFMPKRFSSEMNVIKHLERNPRDFQGAILTISRGMRNLYLHAYQSYVWNHAVSHRWAKYGSKVVAGDLVFVTSDTSKPSHAEDVEMTDPDDSPFQRARPLTEEEVQSGKYTIFDLVLPCPGYDVIYPSNDIGDFYVEFMGRPENGGLNPQKMRRSKKDFSLSGAYRHIVGKFIGEPSWEVRTYTDDNEQMRPTDANLIEQRKAELKAQELAKEPEKMASVSRWNNFAANASVFDDQIATERRRQQNEAPEAEPRVNDVWVQRAEDGSSKRIKTKHEDPRPMAAEVDSSAQSAAPLGDVTNNSSARQPAAPARQPTVPTPGTAGFGSLTDSKPDTVFEEHKSEVAAVAMEALNKHLQEASSSGSSTRPEEVPGDNASTSNNNELATSPTDLNKTAAWLQRKNDSAVKSFTRPDLTGVDENKIKIAVVLEFSLKSSAYATVVLRELMAEVEPVDEGSLLYPPSNSPPS